MSAAPQGPPLPWWLEEGSEQCRVCLGFHHLELVIHCVACDGPLCPSCVVDARSEGAAYCPTCHEEGAP